ncbi:hypothetical protein [Jeotgalibacillus terrae]|uniref:Uncharacterized protein n=1 Tax=Jeotgalibacillus terrae TaxID=587735 RepID=A0ABW5ZHT4_9BACL|nr:hypothetical protein [Jeotgalibacillus terrae]MBM7578782.1 hypothetical protein [Jeotgalibacillus terrae]
MSRKQKYLMNLTLGLMIGLFVIPWLLEWMGFSLADFYNRTFGEPSPGKMVIAIILLVCTIYFGGRAFVRGYRSIGD